MRSSELQLPEGDCPQYLQGGSSQPDDKLEESRPDGVLDYSQPSALQVQAVDVVDEGVSASCGPHYGELTVTPTAPLEEHRSTMNSSLLSIHSQSKPATRTLGLWSIMEQQ